MPQLSTPRQLLNQPRTKPLHPLPPNPTPIRLPRLIQAPRPPHLSLQQRRPMNQQLPCRSPYQLGLHGPKGARERGTEKLVVYQPGPYDAVLKKRRTQEIHGLIQRQNMCKDIRRSRRVFLALQDRAKRGLASLSRVGLPKSIPSFSYLDKRIPNKRMFPHNIPPNLLLPSTPHHNPHRMITQKRIRSIPHHFLKPGIHCCC